jgi:hypothetical protein
VTGIKTDVIDIVDVPITRVDSLASTFMLFSFSNNNSTLDFDDFVQARLKDDSTVTFKNNGFFSIANMSYSVEVVQLGGAVVDRGTVVSPANANTFSTGVLADHAPGQTFSLSSFYHSNTASTQICRRRWMTTQNNTSVTFTRNCTLSGTTEAAWERVQLPGANVQACSIAITTGATGTCAVTAPTPDRTLVLFSGQGPGGQASGQTASTSPKIGYANATVSLSGGTVTATRAISDNTRSDFAPYVIEFAP